MSKQVNKINLLISLNNFAKIMLFVIKYKFYLPQGNVETGVSRKYLYQPFLHTFIQGNRCQILFYLIFIYFKK